MFACGGPVGSRPRRPATTGRVDGVTCHSNGPPALASRRSSPSSKRIGSPRAVPKSFSHRGSCVLVVNDFESFSRWPAGAVPVSTECVAVSRVAWSIS
jgi:hypothetical protein